MLITELKVTAYTRNDRKVCAFVTMTFDNMLAVERIRLIKNEDRLFLAMPNGKKPETGEYYDFVFPINAQVREAFENLTFGAYNYLTQNKLYKVIFKLANEDRENIFDQSLDDFEIFKAIEELNQ